jgi:hypothetical protein
MAAGNLDDFLEDPNRLIMARKPCDEAKRAFGLTARCTPSKAWWR